MKLLIMTGPLTPQPGNNANLIGKLIPSFVAAGHEVHLFSAAFGAEESKLPAEYFGVPVHWATDDKVTRAQKIWRSVVSHVIDPNGWSDAMAALSLSSDLARLNRKIQPDWIITTMEPFSYSVAALRVKNAKKLLYLMDPPGCTQGEYVKNPVYRNKTLPQILNGFEHVVTTKFIQRALLDLNYTELCGKTTCTGFPLIQKHDVVPVSDDIVMDPDKINLLFCGWLNLGIRSPEYLMQIVREMDKRFCLWFVGRDCDLIHSKFKVETEAQINVLPPISYQAAINAMAQADILIGLSNFVPVHMPSKTVEYINAGKPFINFYRLEDCPTLYYTNRYPLCLNIHEDTTKVETAAKEVIDFCLSNRGKTVDTSDFENRFPDCSTKHIVAQILQIIEENRSI